MGAFEDAQDKHSKRFAEIKHFIEKFTITKTPGYAHYQYVAVTEDPEAMKLSPYDVALLADYGNFCFGGRAFSSDGKGRFTGIVHTD